MAAVHSVQQQLQQGEPGTRSRNLLLRLFMSTGYWLSTPTASTVGSHRGNTAVSWIMDIQLFDKPWTILTFLSSFQNRNGVKIRSQEICAHLGYNAAYIGNSAPTYRDNLLVPLIDPISKDQEVLYFFTLGKRIDKSDRLTRNFGTKLSLCVISQKSADVISIEAETHTKIFPRTHVDLLINLNYQGPSYTRSW